MGAFNSDAEPAVRAGELWSQICKRSSGICDPFKTVDEGTPDIVYKKSGYFYVTFHGFNYSTKLGVRGIAKTTDFHHWVTAGPDLPNGPIFAAPKCQAWNPGCVGGGEGSTLIAGNYQYMLIETPSLSLGCTPGQTWPIALLRAPKGKFPSSSSPLWQSFSGNPLLTTAWPGPRSKCSIQYPRWAVAANNVFILYEDFNPDQMARASARRLLKLIPERGDRPVMLQDQ